MYLRMYILYVLDELQTEVHIFGTLNKRYILTTFKE